MKILKIVVDGLPHFKNALEIDFVAQQRVNEDNMEHMYNVFSKIHTNNVVSLIGVNASGKTTILKVLSFVMKMLNNESINNIKSKTIFNDLQSGEQVTITTYFFDDVLYKLETIIEKEVIQLDGSDKLLIRDETLWAKDVSKIKTKKAMYDFNEDDRKERRNQKEQYLMDDVSIVVAKNKNNNRKLYVRDMLEFTDHNMINVLGKFPKELLMFLDPSIEYLKCEVEDSKVDIRLKFHEQKEIALNSPSALSKYLSSGTIKGLSVFMNAIFAIIEGGYLLVDEIENHFNEEIVVTLIRFFWNINVNIKGATLVFSTHYSGLLDKFDRNDAIYIVKNRGGISAENLSKVLQRNDIKKSEIYDSDFLGGTAPSYDAYIALKHVMTTIHK